MLFYFTILKHHFINIPYHFTIPPRTKTLFLLKYYFLTFLYYFVSNRFPGLSNSHFYSSLSTSSTGSTHNTHTPMRHRLTYPNPSLHPHTHKHKHQTSNKEPHTNIKLATKSHTQTQTINRATHTNHQTNPPISKPKPPI